VLHDPKFFNRFQGLTRLIGTQPFKLLDSEEQIRVAPGLGNPPPSLMRKDFHTWRQEATLMCREFDNALRMHPRPMQTIIPSLSSDDDSSRESDDEEPSRLTSPPKFKKPSAPPHKDWNPSTIKENNWWDNNFIEVARLWVVSGNNHKME